MLNEARSISDAIKKTRQQSRPFDALEVAKIGVFYSKDGLAAEQLRHSTKNAALKSEWAFADFRNSILSASSFQKPIENLPRTIELKPLEQSMMRLRDSSRIDGCERSRCIHSQLGSAKIILSDTSVLGPYGGVSASYIPSTNSISPSEVVVTGLMHTHPPPPMDLRGQRSDHASIGDVMNLLANRFLQASIIIADEAVLILLKSRSTLQTTEWEKLELKLRGLDEDCARGGPQYGHEYTFTQKACALLQIGLYRIEWHDPQFLAKQQSS